MRREDQFVQSHRPYAVDLSSLSVDDGGFEYCRANVNAVWFRRRNRITVACFGELWDYQHPAPAGAADFLTRHTDGRYGGNCFGRWDGQGYWGAPEPEVIASHLELLRPMLENYPQIPNGYDGWYVFGEPAASVPNAVAVSAS